MLLMVYKHLRPQAGSQVVALGSMSHLMQGLTNISIAASSAAGARLNLHFLISCRNQTCRIDVQVLGQGLWAMPPICRYSIALLPL